MKKRFSVVIADDHPVVLNGILQLVSGDPAFEVVARTGSAQGAIAEILRHRPDVAILDLRLLDSDALEVMKELRRNNSATRIVVLAGMMSELEIHAAASLGAAGILFKDTAIDTLLACLREVAQGGTWLDDKQVAKAIMAGERNEAAWRAGAQSLTDRESELIQLAGLGRTNKEIASALQVTEGTVKVHFHNIFRKFGVANRAELLAVIALRERQD